MTAAKYHPFQWKIAFVLLTTVMLSTTGCAQPKTVSGNENAASTSNLKKDGVTTMTENAKKSDKVWATCLTPEQFRILREKGTERAFTGKYNDEKAAGTYKCAACGEPLFRSETKFDSGTGWPSFHTGIEGAVAQLEDNAHGMKRVEVTCAKCDGHLGHVFNDGPKPSGLRFCINSESLTLDKD